MSQACRNCIYWSEEASTRDPQDKDWSFGSCRRHPPKIIGEIASRLMPRAEYGEQIDPEIDFVRLTTATLFPATHSHDWCGQFDNGAPL